jgi:membrane protease YdiL (CAAX protease family)
VIALAYLGVYAAAEVLAAAVSVPLGLVVQAGLLVAVLYHAVNLPSGPERTFYLALGLAPLTRIYGLAQPYAGVSPLAWWGLVSIPMIVAAVLALRFGGYTAQEAGLVPSPKEVPVAVLMVPIGLALGLLIYMLLQPRALARDLTEHSMALVALIVVLNPGVVDEIVFRGVLQRSSVGLLGSTLGIVYTSLLYAPVIPAGLVSGSSLMALLIAFGLGVLLSVVTARTGSILSAAVAHASLALCLFVIAPYVVPGGLGLAGGAPSATATAEARPPTAKPVIVSSAQPGLPPAASQPGPTAQPASPIQAGPAAQPGPGQPATQPAQTGASPPVTLATPIAPPSAPAASPAGPPPQPTAGQAPPTGQIVVVRGTGGSGVRLRGQPGNAGQIITVVPEYTALVVIGPDRQVDGQVWHNVRAPNGQEGWIAASFVTTGQ